MRGPADQSGKLIVIVAAIALAGLGAACLRVVLEGRAALGDGDDLLARGKPNDAIAAWETAARWYLPFAPHVDEAYARLAAIGAAPGQPRATVLAAARATRRAARATRSLTSPHDDDLARADRTIAKLSSEDPDGAMAAGATRDAREAWHVARLAGDPRPAAGPAALAVLGIVLWLAGIGILVGRGISRAGTLVRRPALGAAAATLVGLVAWAVGLYNA